MKILFLLICAFIGSKTVYVDGDRLENAPNSFHNVLVHESSFMWQCSMDYSVHLFQNGSVKDDERRILVPK